MSATENLLVTVARSLREANPAESPVFVNADEIADGAFQRLIKGRTEIAPFRAPFDHAVVAFRLPSGRSVAVIVRRMPGQKDEYLVAQEWRERSLSELSEEPDSLPMKANAAGFFEYAGLADFHARCTKITRNLHKTFQLSSPIRSMAEEAFERACGDAPFWITCFALSFIACPNVELVRSMPSRPVRKRLPFHFEFHRVRLMGATRVRRAEGYEVDPNRGRPGLAWHIVHGHYATYSDGPGLFGRGLYGTYWKEPHVRGDVARGIVSKVYVVAPKKAATEQGAA